MSLASVRTVLLVTAIALHGCASAQRAGTTPQGYPMWRVECPPAGGCDRKARSVCEGDYTTVNDGDSYGVVTNPQTGQSTVIRRTRMLVVCLPHEPRHDDVRKNEQNVASEVETSEKEQRRRELEANQRFTRAAPTAPELGATPAESEAICLRQGAVQSTVPGGPVGGVYYRCSLGSALLYSAHVPDGGIMFDAVAVLFEGADVKAIRGAVESRRGPANDISVEGGFRTWTWDRELPFIYLRSYSDGVMLTSVIPPPEPPEVPPQ